MCVHFSTVRTDGRLNDNECDQLHAVAVSSSVLYITAMLLLLSVVFCLICYAWTCTDGGRRGRGRASGRGNCKYNATAKGSTTGAIAATAAVAVVRAGMGSGGEGFKELSAPSTPAATTAATATVDTNTSASFLSSIINFIGVVTAFGTTFGTALTAAALPLGESKGVDLKGTF